MRPAIKKVKEHCGKRILGAEIGVFNGDNAFDILESISAIRGLYLVDDLSSEEHWGRFEVVKEEVKEKLKAYERKTSFLWFKSLQAAKLIFDKTLDFVYIDASHQYTDVLEDIKAWQEKVKDNGILCGHDYSMCDVRYAVDEYADVSGLKLTVDDNDWWFVLGKDRLRFSVDVGVMLIGEQWYKKRNWCIKCQQGQFIDRTGHCLVCNTIIAEPIIYKTFSAKTGMIL